MKRRHALDLFLSYWDSCLLPDPHAKLVLLQAIFQPLRAKDVRFDFVTLSKWIFLLHRIPRDAYQDIKQNALMLIMDRILKEMLRIQVDADAMDLVSAVEEEGSSSDSTDDTDGDSDAEESSADDSGSEREDSSSSEEGTEESKDDKEDTSDSSSSGSSSSSEEEEDEEEEEAETKEQVDNIIPSRSRLTKLQFHDYLLRLLFQLADVIRLYGRDDATLRLRWNQLMNEYTARRPESRAILLQLCLGL